MTDVSKVNASKPLNAESSVVVGKRSYSRPELERYGDIRGMTMGGSPGVGESAIPGFRNPKTRP